jgi:hypothetical protein
MGERSAVRPKSGQSVSQSDPGLRRPTPPSTAGRKPAARPPKTIRSFTSSETDLTPREAELSQHKTVRGAGQRPAIQSRRAAPVSDVLLSNLRLTPLADLVDSQIAQLLEYVRILDRWDRETHGNQPR